MSKLLEGKVAVVTGSGRGIGEAIVRTLADYGAKVVVTDIVEETCRGVAEDLTSKGFEAKSYILNVADFENAKKNVAAIKDLFGRIDIWVNNAGITAV
ncbi:MAG: SDR family NAD(P)-dependent oxidoreductase, partial [Spirochaetales bacterium]|nr:SDR family NAD(P)-dependent oxidoreductase [Spirochaetales bacterium]